MTKLVQLKRYALTPVVDLINHKSGVEIDVSYNYFYGYFAVTTKVWCARRGRAAVRRSAVLMVVLGVRYGGVMVRGYVGTVGMCPP